MRCGIAGFLTALQFNPTIDDRTLISVEILPFYVEISPFLRRNFAFLRRNVPLWVEQHQHLFRYVRFGSMTLKLGQKFGFYRHNLSKFGFFLSQNFQFWDLSKSRFIIVKISQF